MLKFRMMDVGRNKVNKEIEVMHLNRLPAAVKRHGMLMSNDVALLADDDSGNNFTVIVGGYRPVGKVVRVAQ